jgi:tetraacyldisaccharide 4'-kinase
VNLLRLHGRLAGPGGPAWLAPARAAARAGSWLYGLAAGGKNLAYDLGWLRPARLPVPVIGVGNLVAGGAGKTPLVLAVVEALGRLGLPAAVISRGYGGRGRGVRWVSTGRELLAGPGLVGDEPVMLARRLGVPVAVGPERHAVGREVLAATGPRVLVGDDLFQHRRLHRDLDLVCLEAEDPAGGGLLLPRGRLREPAAGLRRAQVVVLTRAEDPERVRDARAWLRSFWGPGPVLACRHRLAGLCRRDGRPVEPKERAGARVLAFCGLARPAGFFAGLEGLGLELAGREEFADHHPYRPAELAGLARRARRAGARALVTSEKDEVRLPPAPEGGPEVWVTRLELEMDGGPKALETLLAWGLAGWRPGA